MLIFNARVYLPDGLLDPGWVMIAGSQITQIGQGEPLEDLQQKVLNRYRAAYLQNGSLAGSVISIDMALKNVLENTGLSLEQDWCMSSLNAAKAIHVDDVKGSIMPGKDADLVLLDEELGVRMTMVEGKIVYEV